MEIDTLSNYEQRAENRVDSTMDVDTENDRTNSPVEKEYKGGKNSSEDKEGVNKEVKETDTCIVESESDEDCEEGQEKLLLSPAHSDDGGEPLSPVNRDLLDSDCEGEREDSTRVDQDVDEEEQDKAPSSESIQNNQENDSESNISTDKKDEDTNSKTEIDNKNAEENCDSNKEVNEENSKDKEEGNENSVDISENEKSNDTMDQTKNAEKEMSDDADEDETQKTVEKADTQDKAVIEEEKSKDAAAEEAIKPTAEEVIKPAADDGGNTEKTEGDKENESKDQESKQSDEEKVVAGSDDDAQEAEKKVDAKDDSKDKQNEEAKTETEDKKGEDKKDKVSEESIKVQQSSIDDDKQADQTSKGCETDQKKSEEEKEDDSGKSLLKESLMKPAEEYRPDDEDIDMDEDFDPSLLMPELSMEVEEAPVITNNDAPAPGNDGSKSPLRLYDPIFSTFVDEITGAEIDFNLTSEELELKSKTFGEKNPVQSTKIHCTACNIHLGSALDGQGNRFVHPLLKVLICKKCYHFYTSGEFEKDEDGSELYCRWCGQGGQVMCCATCEMVFCKKCIRINFDRRKLAEIQKSDDWTCFRCNPSQLINLRIHCAEFMEYVQRELRNASNAANPDLMKIDHCQCCVPQKKKPPPEPVAATPPTRKRKRNIEPEDPDYNPLKDRESPTPSTSGTPTPQKMPVLTPKPAPTVLNATVATKPPTLRPMVNQAVRPRMPVTPNPAARPQAGYVRVAPGAVRPKGTIAASTPTAVRPVRPVNATKHEWFEKTVRAAARVNSNLSYTLTQLNRAQANATSVEALAVVHNKLQEILSSSINSLIQIRKNLRTEFIAGIKNIRFPTTAPPSAPSTSKDDDDVIFIADTTTTPKTTTATSTLSTPTLPPGLSLIKKTQTGAVRSSSPSTTSVAGPSGVTKTTKATASKASTSAASQAKGGFLRVKSFSALQSVTSECITIPDDHSEDGDVEPVIEQDPLEMCETVEKKPEKDKKNKPKDDTEDKKDKSKDNTEDKKDKAEDKKDQTEDKAKNDKDKNEEESKVKDEDKSDEEVNDKKEAEKKSNRTNGMTNGNKDKPSSKRTKKAGSPDSADSEPERPIKKAKIVIERSSEIEKMAKTVVNGTSDESEKEVEN